MYTLIKMDCAFLIQSILLFAGGFEYHLSENKSNSCKDGHTYTANEKHHLQQLDVIELVQQKLSQKRPELI